jgi:hypothetical protein
MGISNTGLGGISSHSHVTEVSSDQVKKALTNAIRNGDLDTSFAPLLQQGRAGLEKALQQDEVLDRLGVIGQAVLKDEVAGSQGHSQAGKPDTSSSLYGSGSGHSQGSK